MSSAFWQLLMVKQFHSVLHSELKMKFGSVEEAYNKLANYLVVFVGGRNIDSATAHLRIISRMTRGNQWLKYLGLEEKTGDFTRDSDAMWDGLDAALFLRDDLLRTTGQRIWGLTFTLYPTGRFNIEYDYNKPEGYEETDEVITGDEINASLAKLTRQGKSE